MSNKENALMTAMTMELKEVSACTKTAEFCVPAEAVKAEFAAVAKEFASQVQIGGFRKGKTPVSLVLARYGAKLAEDVERSIQRAAAKADAKSGISFMISACSIYVATLF